MEFLLGCNYWASHAGTEMWRNWDAQSVRRDLELLRENGIGYLRVFPNWRDFQPVKPLFGSGGKLYEYRMEDDSYPANPYYLDETMLDRFQEFCRIAEETGLRLIVGLLTGWMSGRLFIPSALFEKDLYTDPLALSLEQRFVKGFVFRMKSEKAIFAWDLGNECNCMGRAESRTAAENWTSVISNAIRAADPERRIVSGMHSLSPEAVWTIEDQGEHTDILTTHPYPYWVPHCGGDRILSMKTLLHASAESQLYASIGGKPCLVEEIGTMGPMICSDQAAADFLRSNLWSNWIAGHVGVMWWCAHDQGHLETAPYAWSMCERELGMMDQSLTPKPVLREMKRFSRILSQLPEHLPAPRTDAVCILTRGLDHWGIAYMTYLLAKQAGLHITFCYAEDRIPDADLYLLPSIRGNQIMKKAAYDQLRQRVRDGAILYLSSDGGFLTEFSDLTGLSVADSCDAGQERGSFVLDGEALPLRRERKLLLENRRASVLASDSEGGICFAESRFGEGRVYYLNFPLENMILQDSACSEKPYYRIYQTAASGKPGDWIARSSDPRVCVTIHRDGEQIFAAAVNYAGEPVSSAISLQTGYRVSETLYGNTERIEAFDAAIWKISPAARE